MKKQVGIKKIFEDYLNDKIKLELWQKIGIFCLVLVTSGFFGWIYEFIFYYFNGGMTTFYFQGGNFLPWINIYAIGSFLIIFTTKKFKKSPFLIFVISAFATGILELISGWLVYVLRNGARYWDYNTEILNFGNIGGFVCLRSVLVFGVLAVILMRLILPFFIYLANKINKRTFLFISIFLCALFLLDELYNQVVARLFYLPNAMDIYLSLGAKYNGL